MRPAGSLSFVLLLVVVLLAPAPAPARAAGLADCAGARWLRVESAHFTLYSSGEEADARELVRELEALAWTLDQVGWSRHCARPIDATIFAFADGACYEQFGPQFQGRPVKTAGFAQAGPLGSMMVLKGSRKAEELRVIRHEYVHAMAMRRAAAIPLSLNEGIADFFSTFDVEAAGLAYGHAIPAYQWVLDHKTALTTDVLLGVGHGDAMYRDQDRDLFYAQSWAVAHYLLRHYASENFLKMWDRTARGEPFRSAFRAAYPQEDWTTLAERAARYVHKIEDHIVVPAAGAMDSVGIAVTAVPRLEIEAALGDLLVQQGRVRKVEAEALYQAALATNPNYGPALGGLAMIAQLRGYPRESAALFTRALAGQDADARTMRRAAQFAVRALEADSTSRTADGSLVAERWEPARVAVRQSLALDPGNESALDLASHLARGDSAFAASLVPALEKGHAASPGHGGLAAALALALYESGAVERGDKVRAGVPARCQAERFVDSGEARERARMRNALALLRAGKVDEGRKALAEVRNATTDEGLRASIDQALAGLARAGRGNVAVDAYNAGVDAANAGKLEQALQHFEEARRLADDPELILQAGKSIERIRAALGKRAR